MLIRFKKKFKVSVKRLLQYVIGKSAFISIRLMPLISFGKWVLIYISTLEFTISFVVTAIFISCTAFQTHNASWKTFITANTCILSTRGDHKIKLFDSEKDFFWVNHISSTTISILYKTGIYTSKMFILWSFTYFDLHSSTAPSAASIAFTPPIL